LKPYGSNYKQKTNQNFQLLKMNRLKQLREERAKVVDQMKAILDGAEKEPRSLTPEERTKWSDHKTKVASLDEEISILEEQEKIDQRSAKPVNNSNPVIVNKDSADAKDVSLRGQIIEWQQRNAEAIKEIRSGSFAAKLTPFEFRAADSPMTPTTAFTNTVALNAGALSKQGAQVIDLLRIQPTLWDLLSKGSTNLETYPWVNKKVPASSGAADFLAAGGAKPKVSFTLETEKSNAKKVAVSMKVATELLEDVEGMVSMIEEELRYQVKYEINRVLMSASAGSSTDPAGIRNYAVAYTLSGVQTQNPNNYDAVQALIAQIRASYIDGPIIVGMNPVDAVNMRITKAVSQGQYMGLNLLPVPGGFIYEDYNITAGDVLGFAADALKTLIYKGFRIAWGWENDDFTKNLVTAIGEQRFHQFHSDNHSAAFVYDQLADIKTAIAIP
jgi:HK97 family phage major capsid protein